MSDVCFLHLSACFPEAFTSTSLIWLCLLFQFKKPSDWLGLDDSDCCLIFGSHMYWGLWGSEPWQQPKSLDRQRTQVVSHTFTRQHIPISNSHRRQSCEPTWSHQTIDCTGYAEALSMYVYYGCVSQSMASCRE